MKSSDLIFDYVGVLCYKCHKIILKHGKSHEDSPIWIKIKKTTINSINKDCDNCFKHAATLSLNPKKNRKNSGQIPKMKYSIDKYNWKDIDYPSEKHDWKKFGKNNPTIVLNAFYANKEEKIYQTFISKHDSNREKQITLLIIQNGE